MIFQKNKKNGTVPQAQLSSSSSKTANKQTLSEEELEQIERQMSLLNDELKNQKPIPLLPFCEANSVSEMQAKRLLRANNYPFFRIGTEWLAYENHLNSAINREYERRIRQQLESRTKSKKRALDQPRFSRKAKESESPDSGLKAGA